MDTRSHNRKLERLRPCALWAVLALAGLLALAAPVRAEVFPQHFQGSAYKARKQHCSTQFTVQDDGNWSATTTFTNRRHLDSDTFEAVFRLRDEYGDVAVAIKHVARVRARLSLRRSNVVRVTSSGYIDPAYIPLQSVNVQYACGDRDFIPDHDIVGTLIDFIEHR